jgi:hypothetical protein
MSPPAEKTGGKEVCGAVHIDTTTQKFFAGIPGPRIGVTGYSFDDRFDRRAFQEVKSPDLTREPCRGDDAIKAQVTGNRPGKRYLYLERPGRECYLFKEGVRG